MVRLLPQSIIEMLDGSHRLLPLAAVLPSQEVVERRGDRLGGRGPPLSFGPQAIARPLQARSPPEVVSPRRRGMQPRRLIQPAQATLGRRLGLREDQEQLVAALDDLASFRLGKAGRQGSHRPRITRARGSVHVQGRLGCAASGALVAGQVQAGEPGVVENGPVPPFAELSEPLLLARESFPLCLLRLVLLDP